MRYSRTIPAMLATSDGRYTSMQQALRELTDAERASGYKVTSFFDDDIAFAGFLDFVRAEGQRAQDMVYVSQHFYDAYRHKFPSALADRSAGKAMRDEILAKVEEALERLGLSQLLQDPVAA